MGGHRLLAIAEALAEHQGADESSDTRVDVHDGAAGEVEGTPLEGEAGVGLHGRERFFGLGLGGSGGGLGDFLGCIGERIRAGPVPDHMSNGEIDKGDPQADEQHQGGEFHALRETADDQRRRDAGKGHLEADVNELGDDYAVREGCDRGLWCHAQEEDLGEAADIVVDGPAACERQAVAVDHPKDRHHAHDGEHLHQHGYDVLGAHEPGVEQGKARDRHQQHKHRRRQHPGGVALVGHRRVGGEGRIADTGEDESKGRDRQEAEGECVHGGIPH